MCIIMRETSALNLEEEEDTVSCMRSQNPNSLMFKLARCAFLIKHDVDVSPGEFAMRRNAHILMERS